MPNGPLKTVGEHTVTVAPHTDVVVDIKVVVLGETDLSRRSRVRVRDRAGLRRPLLLGGFSVGCAVLHRIPTRYPQACPLAPATLGVAS